jgi:hypothetical protein
MPQVMRAYGSAVLPSAGTKGPDDVSGDARLRSGIGHS